MHPDTDLVADILGQRPDTMQPGQPGQPGQDIRPAGHGPPTLSPPRIPGQPPVAVAAEDKPGHSVRI